MAKKKKKNQNIILMDSSAVIVYKHQYKQFNIHMIHSNPKKKKKKKRRHQQRRANEQCTHNERQTDGQIFFLPPFFWYLSREKEDLSASAFSGPGGRNNIEQK